MKKTAYPRILSIFIITAMFLLPAFASDCNSGNCSDCSSNDKNALKPHDKCEMAVLWYRTAGETKALYYQAFNIARLRLDQYLLSDNVHPRPAVIVDVDETVLDNSPQQTNYILDGTSFPTGWTEWVEKEEAKPLPGALEFLNYAASKGVTVFYITNRSTPEKEATVNNLKAFGFPFADKSHVLTKTDSSCKVSRRSMVTKNYDIVLLCGDNLNDFADFRKMSVSDRNYKVYTLQKEFGSHFIVLPNPMYGDWESAVYEHNFSQTPEELQKKRRDVLKVK